MERQLSTLLTQRLGLWDRDGRRKEGRRTTEFHLEANSILNRDIFDLAL
jgi:hypothetical protein